MELSFRCAAACSGFRSRSGKPAGYRNHHIFRHAPCNAGGNHFHPGALLALPETPGMAQKHYFQMRERNGCKQVNRNDVPVKYSLAWQILLCERGKNGETSCGQGTSILSRQKSQELCAIQIGGIFMQEEDNARIFQHFVTISTASRSFINVIALIQRFLLKPDVL